MVRPEPNLEVDYKEKYKTLKSKLKCLIYENEYFQQSLKTHQRKFLKATRDRNFLLDRLAKYEPPEHSSTDSDETESSDDENMRQIKRGKYEPTGRSVSMTPPPDTSKTNALIKPKRKKAKAFLMATSSDTVTANMMTDHTMQPEIEHVIVSDMNSVNSDKECTTEVTEEIISEDIPIDG